MPARQNEHIAVLDDTAPSIDEETVVMEDGKLELIAEDNISGINYEAVYATDDAGNGQLLSAMTRKPAALPLIWRKVP